MKKLRRSPWIHILASTVGFLGLAWTGCSDASPDRVLGSDVVVGSGVVIEDRRTVRGITGVELAGIGKLFIDQGGTEGLRVLADDNLIPYLETEVRGDTLVIRKRPGYDLRPTRDIEFHLVVANLRRAELTGAGGIRCSGLAGNRLSLVLNGVGGIDVSNLNVAQLDVTSSGVGTVRVDGTAERQSIVLEGMGKHEARELHSADADVTIRSIGSATVRVSETLDARIDGSGSVYYIGSPVVTRTGSGSGSAVQIDG